MLKTKPLVTALISLFLPIMCTSQVLSLLAKRHVGSYRLARRLSLELKWSAQSKQAKIPKPNVSKEERDAIKLLQKEKSVKNLGADKGRATVVMDTEEFEEKLANMLNDTNTYMKLGKDPTPKYKKKLVEIISSLEREEKIRPEDKKYLYPSAEIVPRIYGGRKIHKRTIPCAQS